MKVNPDQLNTFLQKKAQDSQAQPRAFLLTGNEPFQMMQAADTIRNYARHLGYTERDILHADASFKWGELTGVSNSLSLFSEKKLIDLRIETKTPGKAGSAAIRDYMQDAPSDKLLLVHCPKLMAAARNAAWVKAIDKQGVVVQIWELSTPQTMAWVNQTLRKLGMRVSSDAVRLLTERVEGNLLAAYQEINKLKLLHGSPDEHTEVNIDEQQVLAAVSDSSRFSIFDLSNAVLLGDLSRIQHIHHNLREEGVAIQLVLWNLTDLTRQLYQASFKLNQGVSSSHIVGKLPRPKQKPFQVALQRVNKINWQAAFAQTSAIDRLSKGQSEVANKGVGRVWAGLLELALMLAGVDNLLNEAI